MALQISNSTKPDWLNRNQFTFSMGGPIIKNKTFFFALYDQQIVRSRALKTNVVYTESAKQGICRYYPGWNPGNAATDESEWLFDFVHRPDRNLLFCGCLGESTSQRAESALCAGQPAGSTSTLAPVTLRCFSVFGNQKFDWRNNAMVPVNPATDCPGGTFHAGSRQCIEYLGSAPSGQ